MSRIFLRTIGFILTFILLGNAVISFAQLDEQPARAKLVSIQQRDDGRVAARFSIIDADGNSPNSLDSSLVHIEADNQVFSASSVRALSPESEMSPLAVVFVIDVTPTMRVDVVSEQLPSVVNALEAVNDAQIGLITFSDQILQAIPLSDDLEAIRTAIGTLQADTSLITTDVNTVILGVQEGIDLLDGSESERRVLILITDAVDTQPNQAAIQDVIARAEAQHTAIYTLPLPESGSGRTVDPNLSLPQTLADATDGFVFPYRGEGRTHLAISSELARNLGLLSGILTTEYEAIFNLRGANIGTQADLSTILQVEVEGGVATDGATVSYSEPEYAASLVDGEGGDGLNDGSVVTGNVTLQFQAEPALPDNTHYQFMVDGEDLDCDSETENVCMWNTNFGTQPGFYEIEATAIDSDDLVVARIETLLNVYRNDLEVSLPSSIVGQVPIVVNTVGYEQLADQGELWLVNGEETKRIDLQALGNNDGQVTLFLDTEQDVFGNGADASSQDVLLRVDLRNVGLNTLIARREVEVTVNRIPQYEISFASEGIDFSPQVTYLAISNEPYQLRAELDPTLSSSGDEQFVILLERDDEEVGEFLTSTTEGLINYGWDTSFLSAGVYRLGAAVVRDVENVEQPIVLTGQWHTINLYRPLEASTVVYSQREGNTLYGENQLMISTLLIPDGEIIAVYADGALVTSAAVGNDGETSLVWDIDRTELSASDTGEYLVRIDVLAQDGTTVLGRREESLVLQTTPEFQLVVTGIGEDELIGQQDILAQLDPALPNLDVAYIFFVEPIDGQDGDVVIEQDGTQSATWDVSDVEAGAYTFSVRAYDRASLGQENPQPLASIDIRVTVATDDSRVDIFPWRAAIWALLGVMVVGLIVPLRRRWRVIYRQRKRTAGDLRKTIQTDGYTCTVSWRDPEHGIFDGIEVHSTVTLSIGRREMWWEPDIAFSSRTVSRRLGTMTLLEDGQTLKLSIPKAHHARIMINDKLMSDYIDEGYGDNDGFSYENQVLTLRRTNYQQPAEFVIQIGGTQARQDRQCSITVML